MSDLYRKAAESDVEVVENLADDLSDLGQRIPNAFGQYKSLLRDALRWRALMLALRSYNYTAIPVSVLTAKEADKSVRRLKKEGKL